MSRANRYELRQVIARRRLGLPILGDDHQERRKHEQRRRTDGLATLWLDGALAQFTDEDLFSIATGVFEAATSG